MKHVCIILVAVFCVCGLFAQEPPATQVAIDPDWVVVLEKRIEVARGIFEEVDARFQVGHPDGSAIAQITAKVALTDAEVALYRYTRDATKLLEACERKVEYAQYKLKAVDAACQAGTATFIEKLNAELGVVEAEYDLKKAKEKK